MVVYGTSATFYACGVYACGVHVCVCEHSLLSDLKTRSSNNYLFLHSNTTHVHQGKNINSRSKPQEKITNWYKVKMESDW